jgi:hypothetical protein
MSRDDAYGDIGRTVLPIEGRVTGTENLESPAMKHPFLPDGDCIFFGRKGDGKTTLVETMLLKWGYKFGHIVFCCPHVHKDKLAEPTPTREKYLLLKEHLGDKITFVGMKTENNEDEAKEKLEEAFDVLDEKKEECTGQLLLVLDDLTAFLCYNPIKKLLNSRWVNLKHQRAWGW